MPVRVRLVFADGHVLSTSQKLEGLKRCWLLLKPELATISDLASQLTHYFSLHQSCPNGVLLFMDGFVLPSFESTDIFKENDIIKVTRKSGTSAEVVKIGDDANHIEDSEIEEKQPVLLHGNLLAVEFEKESGGYKSADEEDIGDQPELVCVKKFSSIQTPSKRKGNYSDKHLGSKRKKSKLSSTGKCPVVSAEDTHLKKNKSFPDNGTISEKCLRKGRSTDGDRKSDAITYSEVDGTAKITGRFASKEDRSDKALQSVQENVGLPHVHDSEKKVPSRSACRKKAKRQWRRAQANSGNKELNLNNTPEKNMQCTSLEWGKQDRDSDMEEIVPIVIRPGHIRFEPLEQSKEKHDQVGSLQWNGTTSKKKGQKWDRDKAFRCKMNEDRLSHVERNEKLSKEVKLVPDPIDFKRLVPLTCLPKEGDVVAYRLVELSSSWCPELSSFRVGKVLSYDSASMKIVLVRVPEYPIPSDEERFDDKSALQPNVSLYKKDGSLEIDFPSLVDVRIFKLHKSDTANAIPRRELTDEAALASNQQLDITLRADQNLKGTVTPFTGKKGDRVWEEISQAVNEKKVQQLKSTGWSSWNTLENSTNRPFVMFF